MPQLSGWPAGGSRLPQACAVDSRPAEILKCPGLLATFYLDAVRSSPFLVCFLLQAGPGTIVTGMGSVVDFLRLPGRLPSRPHGQGAFSVHLKARLGLSQWGRTVASLLMGV